MTRKSYKYIILDWDGCIANTLNVWLSSYKLIFGEYGINLTDEEITTKVMGKWDGPRAFGIQNNEEFLGRVVAQSIQDLVDVELHKDVKSVLEQLNNKGKKLALITSSRKDWVIPALKRNKIKDLFDTILGEEDIKVSKPDPEIINKAIERIGAVREETLVLGDSEKDVYAGVNAGVDTLLFYPKGNEIFYREEVIQRAGANFIIKEFGELLEIVEPVE